MERATVTFTVGRHQVAALVATPPEPSRRPLVVALHGGLHNARYFDLPGRSFLELAAGHGFPTVALHRPGYGESSALPPAENTFDHFVAILAPAIAQAFEKLAPGSPGVVLVGHSIGGMLAGMIAAHPQDFPVLGISSHGHGTRFLPQTEEAFTAAAEDPALDVIDFPVEARAQYFFGPPGTFDPSAVSGDAAAYGPMTKTEMIHALHSPERLRHTAPLIQVPVQYVLGQHEALWTATPECVARFSELHSAAPFVDARVMPNVGHNIDQHHLGRALHLRQLAFADECAQ